MGNIIARALCFEDVTRNWPPNHANKKHWCYEATSYVGQYQHYCDDPQVCGPQYDTNFDYSVFRCSEARCQTCLDLNPKLYPARALWPGNKWKKVDPQSQEIHVTWKSLLESTSGGCKICSILKEGIGAISSSVTLVSGDVFCVELLAGFTVRVTLEKPMESCIGRKESLVVEFHSSVDQITPFAWNAFGATERLKRDIGVADCVKFINNSIQKCAKHSKCLPVHSSSTSKLPTRLIDVGADENDVRLETSPKEGERYIALSHAWGTLPFATTITSNLRQHCENITWASLTRTFQDAISITRGLEIRYIWIDSLCIIQDSSSDWKAEAKDMAKIYANSYLTLAATSAAESSEGLFKLRYNLDEDNGQEYISEYEIKRSDRPLQYSIYARRATKYSHLFLLSLEYKGGHKELAPLHYRAWALQERILSPRTLHFSFDEMVWECRAGIDCECGFGASPSGRALSAGPIGLNIFKELFNNIQSSSTLQISDEAHKSGYEEELFSAWYHLVEYYMALSITFPSDRLPALRGMTKSLEEKLGWTFLEGIWVEDFVPGLLWRRNWLRSFRRNEAAPSWSWASMDPIDGSSWDKSFAAVPDVYDVLKFGDVACTVDEGFRLIAHSSCSLEGAVPYQNIVPENQAYIVVEAPFINATIVAESTSPEPTKAPNTETADSEACSESKEAKGPEVDNKTKTERESKALRLSVKENKSLISVSWDIHDNNNKDDYDEITENDEVAAILLAQENDPEAASCGLVLKKVVGGLDLYKRVGVFSFTQKVGEYFLDGTRQVVLL